MYEKGASGLPKVIKQNGEETNFTYGARGLVTRKETPTEVLELEYHPRIDKVTRAVRTSKTSPALTTWSKFDYDPEGKLLFAEDVEKGTVTLEYDSHGRIAALTGKDKSRIELSYDGDSRPTKFLRLVDGQTQSITMQYSPSGSIRKVESSGGRSTTLAVTGALQELLEIIRPAGVSLSF